MVEEDLFGVPHYPVSCLAGTAAEAFGTVLRFHLQGDRVLDPTYGDGLSWEGLERPLGLVTSDIKTGIDLFTIQPSHSEWRGWFDLVFYDPPYFLGDDRMSVTDKRVETYGGYGGNDGTLARYKSFVSHAFTLLRLGGKLVLKCGDQYHVSSRRLILHHLDWCARLIGEGFEIADFYVYAYHRVSPTAWQVKDRPCAIVKHTYFIVGRKPDA